jgi:hypothetical protein
LHDERSYGSANFIPWMFKIEHGRGRRTVSAGFRAFRLFPTKPSAGKNSPGVLINVAALAERGCR